MKPYEFTSVTYVVETGKVFVTVMFAASVFP